MGAIKFTKEAFSGITDPSQSSQLTMFVGSGQDNQLDQLYFRTSDGTNVRALTDANNADGVKVEDLTDSSDKKVTQIKGGFIKMTGATSTGMTSGISMTLTWSGMTYEHQFKGQKVYSGVTWASATRYVVGDIVYAADASTNTWNYGAKTGTYYKCLLTHWSAENPNQDERKGFDHTTSCYNCFPGIYDGMRNKQTSPPQVWEPVNKVGFAIGHQAIRELEIAPGPYIMTGNTVQVTGCTDNTALNFNPNATIACSSYSPGPNNQWSWAYNSCCQYSATTGTTTGATFGISGCTDTAAINYNPLATFGCWGSTTFSGMGGSYNAYADQIAAFGTNCSGTTSYQFTQNCCCDYTGNTGTTTWVSATGMTATTQTCQLSTQDILPCTNGGYISIGGGNPYVGPSANVGHFSIKANNIQIGKSWPQNPTNHISMHAENILLTVNDYNSGGISQPNGMVKITADGFPSTPLFCISMPVSVTHTNDHPTSPVGSITWTADYIFVKTFSGWKRTALSSF
tara:strand:- start:324 stop:1862 length:1539 start_codon:yes stop_codon:yes gene_type:complete